VNDSLIEQIIKVPKLSKLMPDYVKCKICGGKPEGMNWLKPVSPDPNCKVFIHLGCIQRD
jgi:hypothetical protein